MKAHLISLPPSMMVSGLIMTFQPTAELTIVMFLADAALAAMPRSVVAIAAIAIASLLL